jgi:hypothetical protein
MSRTVTAAVEARIVEPGTKPGYFIQIGFPSGIVRHCTRKQSETWNSLVWVGAAVKVSGIEGSGQHAQLEYFDADAAMRTLILADGINDRAVTIWKYYAGALAAGDPVLVFEGVGDGAAIRQGKVSIGLARTGSRTLMSPRSRIGPATGFNHLPPEGTIVHWYGRAIRLERNRA